MNWREHPLLALAGLGLIALALLVVSLRGCGCRGSRPSVAATPAPKAGAGKQKKEWMDDCPEPKDWGKEPAPQQPPPAKPTPPQKPAPAQPRKPVAHDSDSPEKPAKIVRPKDLAKWKPDDYLVAQRDRDPRLLEAVSYLGQGFADKEKAVEILRKLLEGLPASANSDDDSGPAVGRGAGGPLPAEAVVAALAAIDTPSARQVIERLAAGELKTSGNRAAAAAAVAALLGRPSREYEDALFRAVTLAGRAQPAGRKPAGTDAARTALLEAVKTSASASFRLRLANHMIAAETPQTLYDELWPCLQEARNENLAAQVVLYQSDRPNRAATELLERQFLDESSAAVSRLLGVPPSRERKATAETAAETATEADPGVVAGQLWSAHFTSVIGRRLLAADKLSDGARLVLLAGTIPTQPARAALLRTLKIHCDEDPKTIKAGGIDSGRTALEPGFLLLLKMAHKDAPAAGTSAKAPGSPRSAAARDAARQQDKAGQKWIEFTEGVLRAACGRFRAAAEAMAGSDQRAAQPKGDDTLAIKPHPAADVVAAYRLDWPEGLGGKAAGLDLPPLRVRYLRTDQRVRPTALLAYYRRQLPHCQEHAVPQGVWLDALLPAGESAARSIDVLITRPDKDHSSLADQDQRLIVEILAVEAGGIAARSRTSASR